MVDARRRHVHFAADNSETPAFHIGGDHEEGNADQEELVGNSQVHDVHVGDGLHLGIAQHDVDDEGIAGEAHQAHHAIQKLRDDGHREADVVHLRAVVVVGVVVHGWRRCLLPSAWVSEEKVQVFLVDTDRPTDSAETADPPSGAGDSDRKFTSLSLSFPSALLV